MPSFTVKKAKISALIVYLDDRISAWPAVSLTVREGGFWTATIAYEDRETVDERLILDEALYWDKEPFPLLATPGDRIVSGKQFGYKRIGIVHEIQRREYGSIRANGTCELSAGDYACGIELHNAVIEQNYEANSSGS